MRLVINVVSTIQETGDPKITVSTVFQCSVNLGSIGYVNDFLRLV